MRGGNMSKVKERLIECMGEWELERVKEELATYIMKDTDDNIEEYYFDDLATEEEHKEGKLFR